MIHCDYLVIGAGILGLSTAYELQQRYPDRKIVVVEKEMSPGVHQSGHNSGVIHAGIYYPAGSLKAQFCRAGNREIKQFCKTHHIPFDECGKLLVATNKDEQQQMHVLYERAKRNNITCELLSSSELGRQEPNISGLSALLIPSTAIVNYRHICLKLAELLKLKGGQLIFDQQVSYLDETASGVTVVTNDLTLHAQTMIACCGIMADRMVRLLGHDPDFQIIPFRGDYYQLPGQHSQLIKHLIYPVPSSEAPFLGVHLTRMIDGTITVGPNAVINFSREGYSKHSFHLKDCAEMLTFPGFFNTIRRHFRATCHELSTSLWKPNYLRQIKKYCPQLTLADLKPYPSGIRAQAINRDGDLIDDFLFHRTQHCLIVCNAPSPAATSCFPIASYIVEQLEIKPNNKSH